MAYCFPPRGFQTPQTENAISLHNSPSSNGSQQQVVRPSSFQLTEKKHGDFQAEKLPGVKNWNHSGPYNFPPNVSGPYQYQFPPNVSGPQQFPPNVSGPQQFPPNVSGPQQFPPNVSGPQQFPPNVSGPQRFPPNGSGLQQFPPHGPSPNQRRNCLRNPWGSACRPTNAPQDARGFPPQIAGGHRFQGPGMNGAGSRFAQQGAMQPGYGHGRDRKGKNNKSKKKSDMNNNAAKKKEELKHNCDVCDRGFKTAELLQVHISEHVKCTTPGCKFEAHVKVVQLHKKLQHSGKHKVQWLDTPAEIKKWRAERRKNYPTAGNILRKQEAQKRKNDSGAVLQTQQFGKMKKPNKRRNQNNEFTKAKHDAMDPSPSSTAGTESSMRTHEFNNGNNSTMKRLSNGEMHHGIPTKQPKIHAAKDSGKLSRGEAEKDAGKPGSGGKKVILDVNADPLSMLAVSDEESDQEADASTTTQQAEIHLAPSGSIGSLGNLAAAYGTTSSSEEENSDEGGDVEEEKEEPKEACPVKHPTQQESFNKSKQQNSRQKGRSRHGRRRGGQQRRQEGGWKRKDVLNRNGTRQHKATLLEMLLAPDIRHERNVLLQCVRYVVSHNFFRTQRPADRLNVTSDD